MALVVRKIVTLKKKKKTKKNLLKIGVIKMYSVSRCPKAYACHKY